MENVTYFNNIELGGIDSANGVINGVSLITKGTAKGHDLVVDDTTLNQLESSLSNVKDPGIKAKLNHRTGVEAIFGHVSHIRREGDKLKGDLHMLKHHKDFAHTIELLSTMPSQIGLSVAFQGDKEVGADGRTFARCKNIVSVDLVTDPAANPDGLFEAKVDNINLDMDDPNTEETGIEDRIAAIEGFQSDLAEAIEEAAALDELEGGDEGTYDEGEEYSEGEEDLPEYYDEAELVGAGQDVEYSDPSTVDDVMQYFEEKARGALEAENEIRETHEFEQVNNKVDTLIEFAKELEEENELLREALEESGISPVEPGKGELFGFEAQEGTFQFSVQNKAEGQSKTDAIQKAVESDPRGHRQWLVEQGVFASN
jgi:hypothetical protein